MGRSLRSGAHHQDDYCQNMSQLPPMYQGRAQVSERSPIRWKTRACQLQAVEWYSRN